VNKNPLKRAGSKRGSNESTRFKAVTYHIYNNHPNYFSKNIKYFYFLVDFCLFLFYFALQQISKKMKKKTEHDFEALPTGLYVLLDALAIQLLIILIIVG
jgi:hypothetical protein